MPHLYVALQAGIHSDSGMSSFRNISRMKGVVPSPTPIVPIDADSIRLTVVPPSPQQRCNQLAVNQPAVPPPTTRMFPGMCSDSLNVTASGRLLLTGRQDLQMLVGLGYPTLASARVDFRNTCPPENRWKADNELAPYPSPAVLLETIVDAYVESPSVIELGRR